MDDKTLELLIENDKEWRRHMIKTMETVRKHGETNSTNILINVSEIGKLKVWNMVWRFVGTSVFGFFLYLVRDNIF